MKFGKIDIENLKMKYYDKDSSVSAVILSDYGKSEITYNNLTGWKLVFKHHRRVKVFNKKGLDWADVEIDLYHKKDRRESISQLKGVTYNLENDKIVKTKLDNNSVFIEKFNNNNDIKKFTMPNVKSGAIIEYSYTLISDFFFNFVSWNFQHSIPVLRSEFRTYIPEYFKYQTLFQGFLLQFESNTSETLNKSVILTETKTSTRGSALSNKTAGNSFEKLDYGEKYNRWVIKDVPMFIEEPYISTSKNYIFKIKFEIVSTQFPNGSLRNYSNTWENVNEKYLENVLFGKVISGSNFLNSEVDLIINNNADNKSAVIKEIYDFVKKTISWDGRNRSLVDTNLKKPFENKKGSSAEVNLTLISMLQKAGIDANPVLLSTRTNGKIRKEVPNTNLFNYVICKVDIGDVFILLDATDPYLPMNILPKRCLNGEGLVVSETNSWWIPLIVNEISSTQVSGKLNITDTGLLEGTLTKKYKGYKARLPRKNYFQDGEDKYIEDIMDESQWDLESVVLENASDLYKPFIENYVINEIDVAEKLGDKIYLTPIVSNTWDENPFKLENREYPIDFASKFNEKYYVTFSIPKGYEIAEMPEQKAIVLPNKGGKFIFQITVRENVITVLNSLSIKKAIFGQMEYPYVKEFFAQMVAKQKEQIVLKKI